MAESCFSHLFRMSLLICLSQVECCIRPCRQGYFFHPGSWLHGCLQGFGAIPKDAPFHSRSFGRSWIAQWCVECSPMPARGCSRCHRIPHWSQSHQEDRVHRQSSGGQNHWPARRQVFETRTNGTWGEVCCRRLRRCGFRRRCRKMRPRR